MVKQQETLDGRYLSMSTAATTRHVKAGLYDEDFYAWAMRTAGLLRQRRFTEIDIAHLAEELEDIGKRERRALESYLRNVTLHLLKWRYQPSVALPVGSLSAMDELRSKNSYVIARVCRRRFPRCLRVNTQPLEPIRLTRQD